MNKPVMLLVEDDRNDEELARLALDENSTKIDLRIAHDGIEALDYVFGRGAHAGRSAEDLPKVILLDLKLPKLSGVEVLRELRAHPETRFIPVVIFTSSKEDRDLFACYELGANAFVQKPVDFADFSAAVQQLGLFWVLWNRVAPRKEARWTG